MSTRYLLESKEGKNMSDQMNRMKSLLTSYYGVGGESKEQQQRNARNLDSQSFDAETYVNQLLVNSQIPVLLGRDDKLVQEVKTLDADMQLLVYDNYSKFIAATDTIRKMKQKVSEIEGDIERLVSKTKTISQGTQEVNHSLSGKRMEIEKLVGLQRLIRKLKFLFELPSRLRKLIQNNNPHQAVEYYKMASPILLQYTNVASFAKIEEESCLIIDELQEQLAQQVQEALSTLTVKEFNDKVSLLILLDNSRVAVLRSRYTEWQANANSQRLASIGQDCGIEEFVDEANSATLSLLPEIISKFNLLFQPEPGPGGENKDNTDGSSDLDNLLKRMLKDYFSAVRSRFLELDLQKESLESDDAAELKERAMDFEVGENDDNEKGTPESQDQESNSDAEKDLFVPMLGALQLLFGELQTVSMHSQQLRDHRLSDRATEVTEHAIRHQVLVAFSNLRELVKDRIHTVRVACQGEEVGDLAGLIQSTTRGIITDVDDTLTRLRQMVEAGSVLLAELTSIFENLVSFNLFDWFVWLSGYLVAQSDPGLGKGFTQDEECQVFSSQETPVFTLVLAALCQETAQVVEASSLSVVDLAGLLKHLNDSTNELLNAYIGQHGIHLSALIQDAFDAAEYAKPSGEGEPTEIQPVVLQVWSQLKVVSKEVASVTGIEADNLSESAGDFQTSQSSVSPSASGRSNAIGTLEQDVAKMFSGRLELLGPATLTSESLRGGVLRLSFKTMVECVRLCTLSRFAFQQVILDVEFYRSVLPLVVQDTTALLNLLGEVESSARGRCLDPVHMDRATVASICNSKREQLQFSR